MAYGKLYRFSPYTMPALYVALVTSLFAQTALLAGFYIGAPYMPRVSDLISTIVILPLLGIPSAIFGMFAIWPVATLCATLADRLVRQFKPRAQWAIWLAVGALAGGPALYAYSFPLGLGQALLGPLLLNGMVLGLFCAALVWKFAGTEIDDATAGLDGERADNAA